jgi:hypothetical protein
MIAERLELGRHLPVLVGGRCCRNSDRFEGRIVPSKLAVHSQVARRPDQPSLGQT